MHDSNATPLLKAQDYCIIAAIAHTTASLQL